MGPVGAAAAAPPPPHRVKKGSASVLPLLLLAFFGCFMYQTYSKAKPRTSQHDHEESASLMDFCRPGRSGSLGNRTSNMLDRRREDGRSLAKHDFAGRQDVDYDEDGML